MFKFEISKIVPGKPPEFYKKFLGMVKIKAKKKKFFLKIICESSQKILFANFSQKKNFIQNQFLKGMSWPPLKIFSNLISQ